MNVLISIDGVSHQTFQEYAHLFTAMNYSCCRKLTTTFPSVTFTAHATAITGSSSYKHQVFDNIVADRDTNKKISLYGDDDAICNHSLHEQTLFYSLARQGKRSCCIHWPLTSGNPYIDHLVTESSSKKRNQGIDRGSVYVLDEMAAEEVIHAIQSESFDFIAARFIGYDAMSHKHGKHSEQALSCLESLFAYVERIDSSLRLYHDSFNLIVFSDHGQSDVRSFFYPNKELAGTNWRSHMENDELLFVGDGSGAMLMYSSLDRERNEEIMDYFSQLPEVQSFYKMDIHASSSYCPVAIMSLQHEVCGEDVGPDERAQYEELKSLHGYHAEAVDEMNGFMVCAGHGLKQNTVIQQESIMNIASTIAELFGISHACEGIAMRSLMREKVQHD
ncbi:alkaline phosphatase family protein [Paenibacillus chungangensis]|uniref:Alkaline phosphatase family protein n=1 Tax=Paenibacillus chungangensis TaxID=696535 RepID=A0ABW3HKM4_9BACL